MIVKSGWPPDGEEGDFIGWDNEGRMSILRWRHESDTSRAAIVKGANWVGVGLDGPYTSHWPLAFERGEGTYRFVTSHCRAEDVRKALSSDFTLVPNLQVYSRGIAA